MTNQTPINSPQLARSLAQSNTLVPTTEQQRDIWSSIASGRIEPCCFNRCLLMSFSNKNILTPDTLRKAVGNLILRHDALRLVFVNNGMDMDICEPGATDFSKLSGFSAETVSIQEAVRQESTTPFDIENGPLWRCRIITADATSQQVLLFTAHALICDEWSLYVVQRDLITFFDSPPSESTIDSSIASKFSDFAKDLSLHVQSSEFRIDEAFWHSRFPTGIPAADIPFDYPRPSKGSFTVATKVRIIDSALTSQINAYSVASGLGTYAVALTAYFILLRRLSGSADITIGVPFAGQLHADKLDLIGHCVDVLPLLQSVSPAETFESITQAVQDIFLDTIDHRTFPLGRLIKKLNLDNSPGHQPVLPHFFSYKATPDDTITNLVAHCELIPSCYDTVDLNFAVKEASGSLEVSCAYNTQLFGPQTIERYLGFFESILRAAIANPAIPVGRIPLMEQKEQKKVLVDWNATRTDLPYETTLHSLINKQVLKSPAACAVLYEKQSLSYKELDDWSNSIACIICKHGISKNAIVAICAYRSLEMMAGLLGILKAGAAYLPLDSENPQARIDFILKDSSSRVLLVQRDLFRRFSLPQSTTPIILEDTRNVENGNDPAMYPLFQATPDDIAYVIYTSGSTGDPKGVMVPHRGICNRLLWMQKEFELTCQDKVLQKTPYTFDVSVWEFFWPLIAGGTIVFAKPDGHKDPDYIATIIRAVGITIIHFVPSMLAVFVEAPDAPRCASLRYIICSGEALTGAHRDRVFSRMPSSVRLYNLYGPTEASVDVSYWECTRANTSPIVPIGRPIANTCLFVLDEFDQPVPIGVRGELFIGGIGLARGYLNKPGLTQKSFVSSPFPCQIPGTDNKLYRTGDLARWLDNGTIEFLGRLDFQVKIRGFRIELGEIEGRIDRIEGVIESAVKCFTDDTNDKLLVAFVVAKKSLAPDTHTIREKLRSDLPYYMIPSQIVFLDSLPHSSSGKIDRKLLSFDKKKQEHHQRSIIPPRNETDRILAEIWTKELKCSSISISENFFDLGGHSLLLVKINTAINERLDLSLPLISLFEHPTIASLSDHITQTTLETSPQETVRNRALLQREALKKRKMKIE